MFPSDPVVLGSRTRRLKGSTDPSLQAETYSVGEKPIKVTRTSSVCLYSFSVFTVSAEGVNGIMSVPLAVIICEAPAVRRHCTCWGSSLITPVLPSRMRLFLIAVSFLFSFDGEFDVISSFSSGISTTHSGKITCLTQEVRFCNSHFPNWSFLV